MHRIQTSLTWTGPLLVLSVLAARPVMAWGPDGHTIIATVARDTMSQAARTEFDRLLAATSLEDASNFADIYRQSHPETAPWHFVDIPRSVGHYDAARDCPGGACVVEAIDHLSAEIANPATDSATRVLDLKLLVHFIGDIHQPLHCTDDGDRGGNEKKLCSDPLCRPKCGSPCCTSCNLHSAWDGGLVQSHGLSRDAYVALLESRIAALSTAELLQLSGGTPEDWANEAHQMGIDKAYAGLKPSGTKFAVDEEYISKATAVVEDQLLRGAIRLRKTLDAVLTGTAPPPFAAAVPPYETLSQSHRQCLVCTHVWQACLSGDTPACQTWLISCRPDDGCK